MVESISKSVEEQDEIQFSYIGESNNGYGNNYIKKYIIFCNLSMLSFQWINTQSLLSNYQIIRANNRNYFD